MGYGDKLLMEADEQTIMAAIGRWTQIREQGKRDHIPGVVKSANRMLDKYEGELKRRADAAKAPTEAAAQQHLHDALGKL